MMEVEENESEFDSIKKILYERDRQLKGYPCLVEKLETLCLDSIENNEYFFLHFEQNTGLNPFDCLPNSLKTKLLGKFHVKWGNWEGLLLNRHVCNLDIRLDFKRDAEAIIDFCTSLAKEQPQFEKFTWQGSRYPSAKATRPVSVITSFANFANLQNLKLKDFKCDDLHLQLIATHLTKLRTLKLQLKGVTARGISALKSLEHLRKFPFTTATFFEPIPEETTMLYNLCLQILPQLLVIGNIEVCMNELYRYTDFGHEDFYIDFQSLQTPREFGLQQMILHNKVGPIPDGITFPNLTTLCLWHPDRNYQLTDSRFSNVSELALVQLGMDEYLRILKILGHQIRKLGILECIEDLLLDMILRLCPNLKELHLVLCPRNITCSIPLEPDVDLKFLDVLRIDFATDDDESPEFTPGVLVQLLMASNLRHMDFNYVDYTKEDAEAIVRLVQQRQILQSLEIFEIRSFYIDKDDDVLYDEVIRARLDMVLDNMARYCPRFVDYKEK